MDEKGTAGKKKARTKYHAVFLPMHWEFDRTSWTAQPTPSPRLAETFDRLGVATWSGLPTRCLEEKLGMGRWENKRLFWFPTKDWPTRIHQLGTSWPSRLLTLVGTTQYRPFSFSKDSGSSGRQVPAQVDVSGSLCRAVRFNDSPTRLLTTVLLIIAQPPPP